LLIAEQQATQCRYPHLKHCPISWCNRVWIQATNLTIDLRGQISHPVSTFCELRKALLGFRQLCLELLDRGRGVGRQKWLKHADGGFGFIQQRGCLGSLVCDAQEFDFGSLRVHSGAGDLGAQFVAFLP
jgi:hypothetical protein